MDRRARYDAGEPARRPMPHERVLVGIVPRKSDLELLLDERWYRIPMDTAPRRRRWPPRWFAAFEPKTVTGSAQCIRYFGRVRRIDTNVPRSELFPGVPSGTKGGRRYYRLWLETVGERVEPIVATKNRRHPFILTTGRKFAAAEVFSDLFDDSPLEDQLWNGLKRLGLGSVIERQWEVATRGRRYYLDFAIFCESSDIAVEADGDKYHLSEEAVKYDKARDRDLQQAGWRVLRYSPQEIRDDLDRCLHEIGETIDTCGGLADSGLVPRVIPARADNVQGRLL